MMGPVPAQRTPQDAKGQETEVEILVAGTGTKGHPQHDIGTEMGTGRETETEIESTEGRRETMIDDGTAMIEAETMMRIGVNANANEIDSDTTKVGTENPS